MTPETEQELLVRVGKLERDLSSLLMKFEQATGALIVIKWLGALIGAILAFFTFVSDHIRWH